MEETFLIDCPKCGARIEVEKRTGKVLRHWDKPDIKGSADPLKDMMDKMNQQKSKLDNYFDGAKDGLKDRRKELDKKFEEEKKRVKESGDDSKPINPMDLD